MKSKTPAKWFEELEEAVRAGVPAMSLAQLAEEEKKIRLLGRLRAPKKAELLRIVDEHKQKLKAKEAKAAAKKKAAEAKKKAAAAKKAKAAAKKKAAAAKKAKAAAKKKKAAAAKKKAAAAKKKAAKAKKLKAKQTKTAFMKDWNKKHTSRQGKWGVVKERNEAWDQYKQNCPRPRGRTAPASKIAARKYDTAKHAELHLLRTQVEHLNIPFDEAAERKRCEIWGPNWKTTCAWTGTHIPTGKGLSIDHLFPIRGAYGNSRNSKTGWLDGGLRGSDSPWNRVMVLKQLNSGFKIFNHMADHGWKKDVGYQDLTEEELGQCTFQEQLFYKKLDLWRAYARSRGAHYHWKFSKETNIALDEHYTFIYDLLERGLDNIRVEIVE